MVLRGIVSGPATDRESLGHKALVASTPFECDSLCSDTVTKTRIVSVFDVEHTLLYSAELWQLLVAPCSRWGTASHMNHTGLLVAEHKMTIVW